MRKMGRPSNAAPQSVQLATLTLVVSPQVKDGHSEHEAELPVSRGGWPRTAEPWEKKHTGVGPKDPSTKREEARDSWFKIQAAGAARPRFSLDQCVAADAHLRAQSKKGNADLVTAFESDEN